MQNAAHTLQHEVFSNANMSICLAKHYLAQRNRGCHCSTKHEQRGRFCLQRYSIEEVRLEERRCEAQFIVKDDTSSKEARSQEGRRDSGRCITSSQVGELVSV